MVESFTSAKQKLSTLLHTKEQQMKNFVQCPACGEEHPCDKKHVAVENIEEDFYGRDLVTFVCIAHPGKLQKSLVYGKR